MKIHWLLIAFMSLSLLSCTINERGYCPQNDAQLSESFIGNYQYYDDLGVDDSNTIEIFKDTDNQIKVRLAPGDLDEENFSYNLKVCELGGEIVAEIEVMPGQLHESLKLTGLGIITKLGDDKYQLVLPDAYDANNSVTIPYSQEEAVDKGSFFLIHNSSVPWNEFKAKTPWRAFNWVRI
ncbi:MAG: hypothetical protein H6621_13185 [Halobacteriovoraceae bacterium]|nr:hypothetical protein [Halobacteriovoraceae bacterium]